MGKRQKQQQYKDRVKTHDFFGQNNCNCNGPALDDTIGIPHPFPSLTRQEMNQKIHYFDQVAKNLSQYIKQDAEIPDRKKSYWQKPSTSWGLEYLDHWVKHVESIGRALSTFFETYDESKHAELQALEHQQQELQRTPQVYTIDLTGNEVPFRGFESANGKLPLDDRVWHEIIWLRHLASRCFMGQDFMSIEKKFGFPNEDWFQSRKQRNSSGEYLGPPPRYTSVLEMFNGPRTLTARPIAEKNPRPRKNKTALAAIEEIKRHCKAITEEAQAINKSVSMDRSQAGALPEEFLFHGTVILSTYPKALRQTLWNLKFLTEEIDIVKSMLDAQKDWIDVQANLWSSPNEDTWKFGKDQIHQFPAFQMYEYMRNDLVALHQMKFRQKERIIRLFQKARKMTEGGPETGTSMLLESYFQGSSRDKAEREAMYGSTIQNLHHCYGTAEKGVLYVDTMRGQIDKGLKTEDEVMKQISDFLLAQRPAV